MKWNSPLVGLGSVVLAGCASAAEDSASEVDWIVDATDELEPTIDAAEAAAGIDEVVAILPRLHGAPMFEVYDEVMTFGDEFCPPLDADPEGGSMWEADCTSGLGATYSGFVSQFRGDHGEYYEQNMRGEATVSVPDGRTWVVAGQANTAESLVGPEYRTHIDGVFHWTGEVSEGAILSDGWEVTLDWTASYGPEENLGTLLVDGGVLVPEGTLTAVAFGEAFFSRFAEFPCTLEPAGGVAIRDSAGAWHELVFDVQGSVEAGYTVAEGACDGCGTLWHDGLAGDQVCIDTAPLFATTGAPW